MENYSPTPAPLPATISLPEDGIDQVVVSTVRTAIEPLADAIAQNEADITATQNDLDAAEANITLIRLAKAYMAEVSASAVATSGYLTINTSSVNEGFSTFSIGGGGTEVQFPTYSSNDLRGIYTITVDARVAVDDTANPSIGQILVTLYDATGPTETTLAILNAFRYSATASDPFHIHGTLLVDMTGLSPGNSRVRLKNSSGHDLTVVNTASRISIARIGDGDP